MDQQAFEGAVRQYWLVRQSQAAKQRDAGRIDAGTRGQATGGGHLNAVTELLANVFIDAGFERSSVRVNTGIELPGFYRPTKKWDLVVIERGRLVAAIELKSQAGPSFSNNFNNRIEEALGSAVDVWAAYEKGAFGGLRPWLGYLFLLEESPKSTSPVRVANTVFRTDPIFENTSYRDRYLILW